MSRPLSLARLMSFSLTSFVPGPRVPMSHSASSALRDDMSDTSWRVGPFPKSRVKVELSTRHNRATHADPLVEAAIERIWTEHKQRAPQLFNGSKFRLHHWRVDHTASAPVLHLQFGLTDYKTYLATCCSEMVTRLREDGERLCGGDANVFLSRKIGVSAVVETSDRRVALIERSSSVGVYQHLFDTPGGHPEPSALPLTADELVTLEDDDEKRQLMEQAAVDRLFGSIVDEVHEEINVAADQVAEPTLLGVVFQSEAETPSFVFRMPTALSSSEVDALYGAGPLDKFESTQLQWVDASTPLASSSLRLTPAAEGSLTLWQQYAAYRATSQ